jgi:8-oxo-dGTP pyrophosphatase MutT (NUDIX family)
MRKIDDPQKNQSFNDQRLISPQCFNLNPVETVHENPWFVVRNRGGYFTTEYKWPQVIVLPIVDNKYIVMVRVKRPVIDDITLELPAGSAKENETPLQAAARELAEETGILINDLERFKLSPPISGSPNRNPNLLHIFQIVISISEYENKNLHDKEIESVDLFSFKEVSTLLSQGKIYVAVPIAVITRFLLLDGCKTNYHCDNR